MYAYELPGKKILLSHVWNYNRNVGKKAKKKKMDLTGINSLRYGEQVVKGGLQQLHSSTVIKLTHIKDAKI